MEQAIISIALLFIGLLCIAKYAMKKSEQYERAQEKDLFDLKSEDLFNICLINKEIMIDLEYHNKYLQKVVQNYMYSNEIGKFINYEEVYKDMKLEVMYENINNNLNSMKFALWQIIDIMKITFSQKEIEVYRDMFDKLTKREELILKIINAEITRIKEKKMYTSEMIAYLITLKECEEIQENFKEYYEYALKVVKIRFNGNNEIYRQMMEVLQYMPENNEYKFK